jgi:hypothetical protein
MRALLGIFWLIVGLPADGVSEECGAVRRDNTTAFRTVLTEIAADAAAGEQRPADLPEGLREAIEAWIKHREL